MKKELLFRYPPITFDPWTACTLGISMTCKSSLLWTYMNYIYIEIKEKMVEGFSHLDCNFFDMPPWVICKAIPKVFVQKKWENIIQFIIDSINNDFYVYFTIDTFYVPQYVNYGNKHKNHEIFVYGYDKDEKKLNIADFFKYRKGRYELSVCDFDDMEEAYNSLSIMNNNYYDDIVLMKVNTELSLTLTIECLKNNLNNYINGVNPFGLSKWNDCIGYNISLYDLLIDYCKRVEMNPHVYLETKIFNMLLVHFEFMINRINYLEENEIIPSIPSIQEKYKKAARKCYKNQILAYSYNMKKNILTIEQIQKKLIDIKAIDIDATMEFCHLI